MPFMPQYTVDEEEILIKSLRASITRKVISQQLCGAEFGRRTPLSEGPFKRAAPDACEPGFSRAMRRFARRRRRRFGVRVKFRKIFAADCKYDDQVGQLGKVRWKIGEYDAVLRDMVIGLRPAAVLDAEAADGRVLGVEIVLERDGFQIAR